MSFKEWLNKLLSNPVPPVEVPAALDLPRFFSPNYNFESKELGSSYCKDLIYTIRPGNEKLAKLVDEKWAPKGMIRFLAAHPNQVAQKSHNLGARAGAVRGTFKVGGK